jgi:hypothetical protein
MDNRGMTLIEVMVTIFIATAALIVLFGVILYLYQINQISYEQGFQLESARQGVEQMVEDIREATYSDDGSYPIVTIDPYGITFYSDTDNDSSVEHIRYFLSGTNWERGVINATGTPATYPSANERVTILSNYVRNGEQGVPIFNFYNATGTEITDMTEVTDVTFVRVNLVVNISPTHLPDEFMLRSAATIRNLRPNP